MDPNLIDYYIINCAIPSIITIEYRYQMDLGNPAYCFMHTYSQTNHKNNQIYNSYFQVKSVFVCPRFMFGSF